VRYVRGDNVMWFHPRHGAVSWGDLKAMFVGVGGLTKRRAMLLGWRRSEAAANNPVNVMLSY
jgi:hypothetical protein